MRRHNAATNTTDSLPNEDLRPTKVDGSAQADFTEDDEDVAIRKLGPSALSVTSVEN